MRIFKTFYYILLIILLILPQKKSFCKSLSIIRDTEIEEYALKGIKKLFKVAGLNDEAVQVVFLDDNSLNAFVSGGSIVYIHSGLILHTKTPDEFFAVLAHETGHVLGGHTIRLQSELNKAQNTAIITTIMGGIAAIASGRADVGMAVMMGSMGSIEGVINTYRQTEENSADSIAVDLTQKAGYSVAGLYEVMKTIEKEERLYDSTKAPSYLRSHPMTRDRMTFLKEKMKKAPTPQPSLAYDLIKAKLFAFLQSPEETRIVYNKNELPDLYANAIADFKKTDIQNALDKTKKLIEKQPQNPYFYELLGQIYFETGQIQQAIDAYTIAQKKMPKASLIRLSLAHALLESEDPQNLQKAIEHLEYITATEYMIPEAWYFLSIAYARNEKKALADYANIEYLMLGGQKKTIMKLLHKTKESLKNDKIKYRRLTDIEDQIKETLKE